MAKILIIDNEDHDRKRLTQCLSGHEIHIADNGELGVSLYKTIKPDLVLLDLLIPGLDGRRTIAQIQQFHSQARIGVISVNCDPETIRKLKEIGVEFCYKKPFDQDHIKTLVTHALKRHHHPATILIVEDSEIMRKIIIDNLYAVDLYCMPLESRNGQHAFDMIRHWDMIDVILLDWYMPKMDGISFLQKIKTVKEASHIPVIMVTTEGSVERMEEALNSGAREYIVKPFTAEALYSVVNQYL